MVGFVEVEVPTATAPNSSKNGSATSTFGETAGVGRVEGIGLLGLADVTECEALLRPPVDLLAGEARRESVFKMVDLRLVGCGSAEESIGSAGRCTLGNAS
jgi:hypothetical protein